MHPHDTTIDPCPRKRRKRNLPVWRRAQRLDVLRHYGGDPPRCACCGETELTFLALDHVNGGGRQERLTTGGGGYRLWRLLLSAGLPEGFRVLCHNCNQAIGAWGYCGHERPGELYASIVAWEAQKRQPGFCRRGHELTEGNRNTQGGCRICSRAARRRADYRSRHGCDDPRAPDAAMT